MTRVPNHLVGQRVGNNRIELVSLLGEGSYGAVYRALIHRGGVRTPKQCAVKVLRTALSERSFIRQHMELELHQRVSGCDGVVTLYETFSEGHYQFMVMKLCPDRDLWYAINRKRYLGNDAKIKSVFTQVLDAIEYCHSHSVFHRDIKPENILLCEGGRKALLSDFGLATSNCISTETRTGSPWYMSPECWGASSSDQSYATAPNDIWSLGILLINLACRQKAPWNFAHLNDPIFSELVKQPRLFRLFVPLYPEVHDILSRVFMINPAKRINIKDLKTAIQKVKRFGIPTGRLTEYFNYQHEMLRAAIIPAPPRPLFPIPTQDPVNGQVKIGASRNARAQSQKSKSIRVIAPPVVAPLKSQVHHRTETITPSVVQRNSKTLLLSPSPPSDSSVDSDGPVTPQMHAVSDGELPEINIDDSLQDHTYGLTQPSIAFATPKTTCGKPSTPDDPWQSIIDTMYAW